MDLITCESLGACLTTETLGKVHYAFNSLASTNDVAWRVARDGAPHGTLVTAEQQTAGRGRRGRKWASPTGLGIWCSLVVRGDCAEAGRAAALGLIAASATAEAVRSHGVLAVGVKWPNDVVAIPNTASEGNAKLPTEWPAEWLPLARKVAGVLVERREEPDAVAVVGIGVNVHQKLDDFPTDLASSASSLDLCAGHTVHRPGFLAKLLVAFEDRLSSRTAALTAEWHQDSITVGRSVEVSTSNSVFLARAVRIEMDGRLTVETPSGVLALAGGETTVRWAKS